MHGDGGNQKRPDPSVQAPCLRKGQRRHEPAGEQRLDKHQHEADDPRKARRDVDRAAPLQQRAGCGDRERDGDGSAKRGPGQDRQRAAGRRQAGTRTKSTDRRVSPARAITGRRKTVSNPPSSKALS